MTQNRRKKQLKRTFDRIFIWHHRVHTISHEKLFATICKVQAVYSNGSWSKNIIKTHRTWYDRYKKSQIRYQFHLNTNHRFFSNSVFFLRMNRLLLFAFQWLFAIYLVNHLIIHVLFFLLMRWLPFPNVLKRWIIFIPNYIHITEWSIFWSYAMIIDSLASHHYAYVRCALSPRC